MPNAQQPTNYARLVRKVSPRPSQEPDPETGLDALINQYEKRKEQVDSSAPTEKPDPVQLLRENILTEYMPIFVELSEKYAKADVLMEMDASDLLQGGREIKFRFAMAGYRTELLGTATSEAIAFHETRYSPDGEGELASGPLLRLRRLNAHSFREFVCNQLAILVRNAMRRM